MQKPLGTCSFCQTYLENCTTFWQNKLIRIEVPNSPKRLSIGGVSHAPMLTGEKERQQACQSLSTSTRPCAWYSVLGTVRTVHTQLIRTPRLAISTAARWRLLVAGESGVRQCDGATCGDAAWGSGVRRRWRGGCGGNGKALYFNAAPYIYSATHSVSLTSTTRLQSRVAL